MDPAELPWEDIYGHMARLTWIQNHVQPGDRVLDFGCGTGFMITWPLKQAGVDVIGIDSDGPSVAYGQTHFSHGGIPFIQQLEISEIQDRFEVVIASEVLEHVPDPDLDALLRALILRLEPGGRLLITVPNGYGWFEAENFFWKGLRLQRLIMDTGLSKVVDKIKALVFNARSPAFHPSTLSSSPHVQRFTLTTIRERLRAHGLDVMETQGSVLVAGPLTNVLFSGFGCIGKLNRYFGQQWAPIACGFYLAARKPFRADSLGLRKTTDR